MQAIWKYQLPTPGETSVLEIPKGWYVARIDAGWMWVWVSPDHPIEQVKITTVATGQRFDDEKIYLGTWLDGPFVWHVIKGSE